LCSLCLCGYLMVRWRYQPNFCCDCGERIRPRKGLLSLFASERFCSGCARRMIKFVRFRALLPLCLIASALFLVIIPARERPPAVVPAVQIRQAPPPRPKAGPWICGAPTRKGGHCRRRVKTEGYCWQHREQQK
jgi:hypothetical protein